ncbi:efflux RND transporter permease subunit [Sphingomonas sp. AP4-R1]|uniref:efflux RND transporter permease subunit n=1 Tax=Sphingomonas sp. AP4-R1 TaxID=2735134 RepID=UPI001493DAF7|nr:efflux RND transporter permease subunit [Sphingomonas sp. AP4-R1]QJU59086.1 efflux RND transporter permease subunit [Sphingomonas sp. AP4-R1]
MLTHIVRWSLARPWLVTAGAALLLIYGAVVLGRVKFDVFPDFVPSQAEVQTEAPGLSPDQVEQLVTRPIEQAVNGAAGVASVRSESIQGLSIVTVIFADGVDPYRARQIVAESLSEAAGALPQGVKAPKVQPLTSSTMDLLKVGFTSDKVDPTALRDFIQWQVRPRLLAVPGVARATVYGGIIRRVEVQVRPDDLAARDLALSDVASAVQQATSVIGGGYIDTPQQRLPIDAHGQARGAGDIAAAPLALPPTAAGAPATATRVGDVATVAEGASPNNGDALIMGKPGVLISLSSQYGANTLEVTRAVEAALAEFRPALAAQEITMRPGLHRPANFIDAALHGIMDDLVIGAVLIAVVLLLMMRNVAAVLISFVSIPLSLLTAIIIFDRFGVTINTMTLGGMAVALGVVVDDAIIDVENIIRRLRSAPDGEAPTATILAASVEVRAPVIYATLVVSLVLAPVLMLSGLQGAFFAPLATAFILATLASLVVAIVVTPALSLLLLRHARLPEEPAPLRRLKDAVVRLLIRFTEASRLVLIGSVAAVLIAAAATVTFTTELLPSFKEGHFVLGVTGPPGTSLSVMRAYGQHITRDLLAIPGIDTVEQQIGRAEGGEDTWGSERSEFHVELKPGLSGAEQDDVQDRIHAVLDGYPGLVTEVLTFLGDRIGESLSGETASLAIGIYGGDSATLDRTADRIVAVVETVQGAVDVQRATPPRTPVVRVGVDTARAAARGIGTADILSTVQAAYQGNATAQIFKQDRSIDVALTVPPELRETPEAIGNLLVRSASGVAMPLGQVARVSLDQGRTVIAHEGGRVREVVTTNPPPQQAAAVTAAVKQAIADQVKLPPGVYLEYEGTADAAVAARNELLRNVGFAIAGMIALLAVAFGSWRSVALIFASAPLAMIGGVIAVLLSGRDLSLGSLVGFVTLFGVAARNTILLLSHADHLVQAEGHPWSLDTLVLATRERMTPILMTALVTGLGLLPLAIGSGQAGREIQGPMAIVIMGGLVSSTLTTLLILPALIWRFGGRRA